MNFDSSDVVQVIIAIIGLVGVVFSVWYPVRHEKLSSSSVHEKRAVNVSPPSRLRFQNKVLWASIVLFTVNSAVLGWRFWGPPSSECRYVNLLSCSVSVPIFNAPESNLTTTIASGNLEIDFSNDQDFSGVALQFVPTLNVREFTHLDISGITTEQVKFVIEYKARVDNQIKVVATSAFQSFLVTKSVSTIKIPLKYDGTVDEIALMFYEKGEHSQVSIESVRLLK